METNREKLEKLNNKDFMEKMHEFCSKETYEFTDWDAWLDSTDDKLIYIGKNAFYKPHGGQCEWRRCIMVGESILFGSTYYRIIDEGLLAAVPKKRVKFTEEEIEEYDESEEEA